MTKIGTRWVAPALFTLTVVVAGCLEDVTGTRPLTLDLSSDRTSATVGQTVTISFTATGTALSQVSIDFADGASDVHTYPGPVEAAGFSTHEYMSAGTYVVRGTVVAAAGSTTDSVTVTVN